MRHWYKIRYFKISVENCNFYTRKFVKIDGMKNYLLLSFYRVVYLIDSPQKLIELEGSTIG